MQFILENYLVIILIGMFLIFALIGYLIDLFRKNTNQSNNKTNDNTKTSPIFTSYSNDVDEIRPPSIQEESISINNNNQDELIVDNNENNDNNM